MKPTSNERGAVPILVIVLALVLVAAVGLAVYNVSNSSKNAQTVNSTNTSPSSASSPGTGASSAPTPTPSNVFIVKELGIQFTITTDIKDLVYSMTDLGGTKAADFSTTSLINAGQSCATDQPRALLGRVYLSSETNVNAEKVKQLGNQYLYYAHPQAACSNSSSVSALTTSFKNALKTAELTH
jgi:hypothetical protein